MLRHTVIASLVLAGSLSAGALLIAAGAQPERSDARGRSMPPPAQPGGQPGAQQGGQRGGPQGGADMGQRLIAGLMATPGCLKADATAWRDGRNSIFAWFENKAAVERWYYSDAHQGMMGQFAADPDQRKPLEHVEDPDAPVLVIATINFNGPPAVPGPIPFSEIAIELFAPLPGGAFIGRRLSPESFEVPHMRDFTQAGYSPAGDAEE